MTFVPGGPLYGMGPGRIVPELAALDPSTGEEQWCKWLGDVAGAEPTMLADDAAVVVAGRSRVVALEPSSGAMRWSVTMDAPISAAARNADAIVVADRAGNVRALDVASGGQRRELADLGTVTSMAADGAAIYAGIAEGRLMRINPDAR